MEYDVVLFNTMANYPIVAKTAGAYKIASSLRQEGYSVKVIDHFYEILIEAEVSNKDYLSFIRNISSNKTFLVGISSTWIEELSTPTMAAASDLKFVVFFDLLKTTFPNAKIVMGGYTENSYSFYNKFNNYIDIWLNGLADTSIKELCKNLEVKDKLIYSKDTIEGFRDTPPTFCSKDSIIVGETLPLEISRGCRFKCKFCSFALLGRNPKNDKYLKSKNSLYSEMKFNYDNWNTTNYFMLCDTFNETTDKLESILEVKNKLGIELNFSAYVRLDLLYYHREQMSLLKELGLKTVFFGLETLNDKSGKSVGKGLGKSRILDALELAKKEWGNEVRMHGHFIAGLPFDTPFTVSNWAEFLLEGNLPLDTWILKPLHINPEHLFTSEFERNYEKYGYKIGEDGYWFNDNWNFKKAEELSNQIMSAKKTNTPNPWDYMALKNYKLPDHVIDNIDYQDLRAKKYQSYKIDYLKNYIQKLWENV